MAEIRPPVREGTAAAALWWRAARRGCEVEAAGAPKGHPRAAVAPEQKGRARLPGVGERRESKRCGERVGERGREADGCVRMELGFHWYIY